MPQVDLETLMSACSGSCSDRKIACETSPPLPDDFPPESFWVSKDAEIDWFDRNAIFERNESTKGTFSGNLNSGPNPSSQRYSITVKSKPSIIGLPKTQKTNYVDKNRKKSSKPNIKFFPKRTGSVNKSGLQLTEPSSPNVSCMGRVKSKRKNRKRIEPRKNQAEPVKNRSRNICKQFLSIFKSDKRSKPVLEESSMEHEHEKVEFRLRMKQPARNSDICDEPEAPGLGGMKRFASGRRSTSSIE